MRSQRVQAEAADYVRNARVASQPRAFGAAQLNDRFRAAGIVPDDQAWLGWFAVKLSWEAALRDRSPAALRYDGHKGMPLRFNAARVLQQPLYES